MMRFGIDLPNFGPFSDPFVVIEFARLAEQAGWDGFFLWDHIDRPTQHPLVDPWMTLAAVAVNTQRIKIGALVTPLPRRRPWKVARQAVALDQLSRGRLIFGAGLGTGRSEEWGNFGEQTDAKARGGMLDEGLDILTGLWSGQPFSYTGQYYRVGGSTFTPPPVQQPRIPIWIAGAWPNKAPFRRAARWDGMCPLLPEGNTLAHLKDAIEFTQSCRADPAAPFDFVYITGPVSRDPAQFADQVAQAEAMGVTWWIEEFRAPSFGTEWTAAWDVDAMRAHVVKGVPR
ncbi:MAG: LLM class flavin-dependent oxidoreductase [Chloroflexi bacterium]|nr:LLM class flavin-dependent oxidoreductase [Chloroflexota bacterium]